jgi:hypothetical protein
MTMPAGGFRCVCRSGFTNILCDIANRKIHSSFVYHKRYLVFSFFYKLHQVQLHVLIIRVRMLQSVSQYLAVASLVHAVLALPVDCVTLSLVSFQSMFCFPMMTCIYFEGTSMLNACATNPCMNDGMCQTVPGGGYRCHCRVDYTGAECDISTGLLLNNLQLDIHTIFFSSTRYTHFSNMRHESMCQ